MYDIIFMYNIIRGRPLITSTIFCHFLTPPLSTIVKHWRTPLNYVKNSWTTPLQKLQKFPRTLFLFWWKNAIVDKFHCWCQLLLNPSPCQQLSNFFKPPLLFCWVINGQPLIKCHIIIDRVQIIANYYIS